MTIDHWKIERIAAMAYGTATVPAVDKIVGPGNAYVNEAKRQIFGQVGIDQLDGPSEPAHIAEAGAIIRETCNAFDGG